MAMSWCSGKQLVRKPEISQKSSNMSTVQLLWMKVHTWIRNAVEDDAEDFLYRLEKREAAAKPMLRALLTQRLMAVAEKIFALMGETVEEYERKVSHQRMLLDAVLKPKVRLYRADIQQLLMSKREVPPKQLVHSSSVDQEDPEPFHIKEELEEVCTIQEGEQLQGLKETDINALKFPSVPPKSEDDEEKPNFSQLHHTLPEENRQAEPLTISSTLPMKTEADGDNCGGSEPTPNLVPDTRLQPDVDDTMSGFSETETEDSQDDWIRPSNTSSSESEKSNLNFIKKVNTQKKPDHCSINNLKVKTELKLENIGNTTYGFSKLETKDRSELRCSRCGLRCRFKSYLHRHMRTHTGEKPFSCSICRKTYKQKHYMIAHMRTHTGEKPFSCSVCKKSFTQNNFLKAHIRTHTGEKPYPCSVCKKTFSQKGSAIRHMKLHSVEKPFPRSVYQKTFP
ncbi:uncharacterized protein ACBR49_008658 [Aulostomus maculatus]